MSAPIPSLKTVLARTEKFLKLDLRYIFKGVALLASAEVLLGLLSLGVSVLIAHFVTKEVFGAYRYLQSIATIAVALSLTGMNSAVIRAVAAGRDGTFRASFKPQIQFALLQGLGTLLVSGYYFYQGHLSYGFSLLAIAVLAPAGGVLNTYNAYLNGKKEYGRMALWKVQNGVLSAAVMASVVLTTPTVLGMTIAYFASTVIANAYFTWRTFQTYRPPASASTDDLSYGKHLSVMGSFGIIATQFDNIVVYQLLGPAALATYSFALLIPERMRTLLGFIPNIALPKLSQRNAEDLRTTATHRSLLGLIFASGVAIVYALAAPFIFSIFFPQYQDAVAYTQLASLFALTLVPTYLSTVLTAQGAKRALYIVSIASPIVKTVLSIFCIFAFGLWGAIAARIVAAAFSGATSYALLMRQTDGKPLQS